MLAPPPAAPARAPVGDRIERIDRARQCAATAASTTSDWPGPRVSTRITREVIGAKYWKFEAVFRTAIL